MTTLDLIQQQVSQNPIILFMKGTPQMPQCGFSSRAVQALMACGKPFAFVDVIANPEIRAELPKFANWPTFPQLYIKGELIGGCDIITELFQNGELQTLVDSVEEKISDSA